MKKKIQLTLSEAGRIGGLKGGKAKVPKGFAVNRKAIKKAHATQKANLAAKRKAKIERASKNTVSALALAITNTHLTNGCYDAEIAAKVLEAIRQKRVCNLLFKVKP